MIERSFYQHLQHLCYAFDTAVYPHFLPEDRSLPAVTYRISSSRPEYSADGPSNHGVTFQVDCWSQVYLDLKKLRDEVKDLLDGYTGELGEHYAHLVQIENEVDTYEPETKLFRVSIFFNVFYRSLQ